jgi:hypothetical protein
VNGLASVGELHFGILSLVFGSRLPEQKRQQAAAVQRGSRIPRRKLFSLSVCKSGQKHSGRLEDSVCIAHHPRLLSNLLRRESVSTGLNVTLNTGRVSEDGPEDVSLGNFERSRDRKEELGFDLQFR